MSLSVSLSFIFSDLLMMKNTKTVAVSTVLSDHLEAIANNIAATYNIAATVQIQPSMSEPADVSLPLPSSDLLLMDTKTAAVSTVLSDRLEAIAYNIAATYNIAAMAQI
jgi:folate-dependent phosphoribosylglycinamide formyltransferase PurN